MDETRRREIEDEELYRVKVRARTRQKRRFKAHGFSTLERVAATYGVIHDPITTGIIANDLLQSETDPERRADLDALRSRANVRMAISIIFAAIVLVVFFVAYRQQQTIMSSQATSHSRARNACVDQLIAQARSGMMQPLPKACD